MQKHVYHRNVNLFQNKQVWDWLRKDIDFRDLKIYFEPLSKVLFVYQVLAIKLDDVQK